MLVKEGWNARAKEYAANNGGSLTQSLVDYARERGIELHPAGNQPDQRQTLVRYDANPDTGEEAVGADSVESARRGGAIVRAGMATVFGLGDYPLE